MMEIKRLFAIDTMPASSPTGSQTSSELVIEDPVSTDNFATHKLTKRRGLPSGSMTLPVRVVDTKNYRMRLEEMQGRKCKVPGADRHGKRAFNRHPWRGAITNRDDVTVTPLYRRSRVWQIPTELERILPKMGAHRLR